MDVTSKFLTDGKDVVQYSPRGFSPPWWTKDEKIQEKVKRTYRLTRGFMNENVLKIVFQEASKDLFDPYELVNVFQMPCFTQTMVTSLMVGLIASTMSSIGSRNPTRTATIFGGSTMFSVVGLYASCQNNLNGSNYFYKTLEIEKNKDKWNKLQLEKGKNNGDNNI
ncbi:hypothetical protein V1514DRAFT_298208 [Lipomyces japonicus]|uniref:uncharacterized protein n=1 Tax=Lipomyces japonicus TaxID=56871 RepID=UPI0034CD903E